SRAAQGGAVPLAGGVAQQHDIRLLDGKGSHLQAAGENQRLQPHTNLHGGGLQKRALAESRIVGNRDVVGRRTSAENRGCQLADVHLTIERRREPLFQLGTERVNVDKQGQR